MIWNFLAALVMAGTTIWSTVAQNKEREKAEEKSLGFAERKLAREDKLIGKQEGLARQELGLKRRRLGLEKEGLEETKRLNRGKQLLSLLGADSQMSKNVNDLWTQMGILEGGI